MGSAFYSETSLQVVRERMQKEDISLVIRNMGRKILSYIPILPMPILNQYIRMFHFAATGQMIQPDEYVYQSDLEKEAKDILIIFTSQCCNAAIEGKMSIKAAKELEARTIRKIEKCKTVTRLTGLRHEVMQEYITRVHEISLASGISRPIRLCCDYVKILLISTEYSIQEISERCQFGSRNYFTRMFRVWEGVSPKEYRERARDYG